MEMLREPKPSGAPTAEVFKMKRARYCGQTPAASPFLGPWRICAARAAGDASDQVNRQRRANLTG
jgi:hypothetical protein